MAELDRRFLEHFEHPRNVGPLADATGRATEENPACGDLLTFEVRVVDGRVAAAAFTCQGCAGSIAAASVASELVVGLAPAEARGLGAGALEAALGGLPALKRHGADLAASCLAAAIRDHEARHGRGGAAR